MIVACLLAVSVIAFASDATYEVSGLENPAEIIVDEWGVPHIYAGTHYDAFFVQGFNAARDRLWQIDTWRRRGLRHPEEPRSSSRIPWAISLSAATYPSGAATP